MSDESVVHNELALAYEPVTIRHRNGGVQALFKFPNRFGASVVRGPYTYGGDRGLWELAVVQWDARGDDFELTYETDITEDVLGHLTPQDVDALLLRIHSLNADGHEPEAVAAS